MSGVRRAALAGLMRFRWAHVSAVGVPAAVRELARRPPPGCPHVGPWEGVIFSWAPELRRCVACAAKTPPAPPAGLHSVLAQSGELRFVWKVPG